MSIEPLLLSRDELADIASLRSAAWGADFGAAGKWGELEPIDAQAHAHHFGVRDEIGLCAASRLVILPDVSEAPDTWAFQDWHGTVKADAPIGHLSRLVVLPRSRGRGITHAMDEVRERFARRMGCRCLIGIVADEKRMPSLERRGFRRVDVVDVPTDLELPVSAIMTVIKLL